MHARKACGLTRSDGYEDLEDGALGIAVANGRRDRGKPFDGIALGQSQLHGRETQVRQGVRNARFAQSCDNEVP